MRNTNKKGFTIVELVIVVAVIAILAAVLIPTFASIIKEANLSVDMQVVRQMNTVLAAEEIEGGKPATVTDAKEILVANNCDDFTPTDANNIFYWVGAENRVLLWTWTNDEKTEGEVAYPEELAKKYAVKTPSADWSDLKLEYNYTEVEAADGETIGEALMDAIKDAPDGAILKMPENATIDLGGDAYWIASYLKGNGGVGKSLTIDLNGGSLISNETLVYNGVDYGYYGITVPANGELVLVNGNADITTDDVTKSAFAVDAGASLILRDVKLTTNGSGILPSSTASEVVLEGCEIVANGAYGLGTNRLTSSNIRIDIKDSKITSNYSTGMLINCSSDVYIENSTITGIVHGIAVRAGHVVLANSTIVTTETDPSIYAFDNFAAGYNFQGWWRTGNTMPGGTLVVGDYAKANGNGTFSYSGDAIVEMTNTKLQSADAGKIPTILLASSDPAKNVTVTYDNASNVGTAVVYGSVWNGTNDNVGVTITNAGNITVNGNKAN